MLVGVQSTLSTPATVSLARAMSHFGEHAAGWVVLSVAGALLVPGRRREWLLVGVGSVAAHAASILIKLVGTPSSLSFPSAHATSSTAAAVLLRRATRSPLPLALVPLMATSRLVLGVHYPTDVIAGIAVGAAVARTVATVAGPGKEM